MIRSIWKLLIIIPMPWRATIVLLLLMPSLSWLFWRGFPWLLAKTSQVLLICVQLLVRFLLLIEYLITQHMRRQNLQLLPSIYLFGDALIGIVSFVDEGTQRLERLLSNALRRRWQIRKGWYQAAVIILPLIWFIRPVLGETMPAKLINGGWSWWDSLEGWALTGKWPLSVLSSPPEQFVKDYYSDINNHQYLAAWSRLSPKFKSNKTLMPNGYSSYRDRWKSVGQINVNRVTRVSKNNKSATIDVYLQYLMKETKNRPSSATLRLSLVWDAQNSRWLINAES